MNDRILVIDDDDTIREGLALGLEAAGRSVITCPDIESAQIVVENERLGGVVCDVHLSGPLSIDGIDFIDHVRTVQKNPKIVIMSGSDLGGIAHESMRRGATHFLSKPFNTSDLERLLGIDPLGGGMGSIDRIPPLSAILEEAPLTSHFQPIVSLAASARPRPFAYEALIRFPGCQPLGNPELLFEYARRKVAVPRLEVACLTTTMTAAVPLLRGDALLFVNVSPLSLRDRGFATKFTKVARSAGLPLDRLVIEITEQDSFDSNDATPSSITELARQGVRFAFDDVGSAYSHLMQMDQIQPRFLKISHNFGTGFEQDPTKGKIVRNILALARDFACDVILEGVETEETLKAARAEGIQYAQGYHIARPAPAETFLAH